MTGRQTDNTNQHHVTACSVAGQTAI